MNKIQFLIIGKKKEIANIFSPLKTKIVANICKQHQNEKQSVECQTIQKVDSEEKDINEHYTDHLTQERNW